jgi:hypothetical protein
MESELFDDLLAGLNEMVAIEKGAKNDNDTRVITSRFSDGQ